MNSKVNTNNLIPTEFYLGQNYPNPFHEKTTIKFCVSYRSHVKLELLDSGGKTLAELMDEEKDPGTYQIEVSGFSLHKGRYSYKLQADDFVSTKEMMKY